MIALLASGVLSAGADPNLPPQTAAQLLAAVGNAKVAGFSGTVVEKASLGLPELPAIAGADDAGGLTGLLTGSHTIRLWYGGETRQRIALLSSLGEQDVFRNGRQLWQWNSDTRTASHSVLPSDSSGPPHANLPVITPDQAAQRALAMIEPSTEVSTDHAAIVAGRSAYVLVLRPKDGRSLVGSVRISVDGKTRIPLGVQVLARGSDRPAIDISFTRFSQSMPDEDNFNWTPPAGVRIVEGDAPGQGSLPSPPAGPKAPAVTTIGEGWSTIAKLTGVAALPGSTSGPAGGSANGSASGPGDQVAALLNGLPKVSGSWGSGRLFRSALLSALLTDDGRVYVGAVDPELLYHAAALK
jgi:outer membrane lipoprotein-sorting protein